MHKEEKHFRHRIVCGCVYVNINVLSGYYGENRPCHFEHDNRVCGAIQELKKGFPKGCKFHNARILSFLYLLNIS